MAIAEVEAKTKWCPFVRIVGETDGWHPITNRGETLGKDPDPQIVRCIGSACMAWREKQDGQERRYVQSYEDQDNRPSDVPDGWLLNPKSDFELAYWFRPSAASGYCGLAGRP